MKSRMNCDVSQQTETESIEDELDDKQYSNTAEVLLLLSDKNITIKYIQLMLPLFECNHNI